MAPLNLPDYSAYLKFDESQQIIFDQVRKKQVALTPEEWVRQNFIQHLKHALGYPLGLMSVEKNIVINKLKKRCDIVIYNKQKQPTIIVECKAPTVNITQKTFDQIAIYNIKLQVRYLIVTNGLNHFCCQIDSNKNSYSYLENFPFYNGLW
jgi:hypothetical protein